MTTKNIHDKTVKAVLSDTKVARAFFEAHLPKQFKREIQLDSLEPAQGTFVDKHLKERMSDLLYRVKTIQGEQGYLYLLFESQSTPDPLMPFRLLQYCVNIMDNDLSKQKISRSKKKLPLVYPVLYYHGKRKPYPYSLDILDCFRDRVFAKQYWAKPAQLVDLTQIPDDQILRHDLVAGLEMIQKHIYERDLTTVLESLLESGVFVQIEQHPGKCFEVLLKYAVERGDIPEPEVFFKRLTDQLDSEELVMTIAQRLRQEGVQLGIEQGIEQGLEKGLEQGFERGVEKGLMRVSQRLLQGGADIRYVADVTGLSIEKLAQLKNEHLI